MKRHQTITTALSLSLLAACGGGTSPVAVGSFPEPVNILFVGNSYTFARIAPALQYNAKAISDLTAAFNDKNPSGGNSYPIGTGLPPSPCAQAGVGCFEPHPWGGVPGIFKKFTDIAGLRYNVSMSARNAATMRGQFLNTANADWDLRGNIASNKWNVVVLQAQSDEPLSPAKAKNGNPVSWRTYVNKIVDYITVGKGGSTTEADIFGGLANCTTAVTATVPGPGLSSGNCTTVRDIPNNANANPDARIYLYQTWARPDMVEPHLCTAAALTTMNGAPKVDPTCSTGANGSAATGQNTIYYTSKAQTADNLRDMTNDMRDAFKSLATSNPKIKGVAPVGEAFQRTVDNGLAKASGFYNAQGTYDTGGNPVDLWWIDRTHPSVYGSYLAALVLFGTITGVNPTTLGSTDAVAAELGISPTNAASLQRMAAETIAASK